MLTELSSENHFQQTLTCFFLKVKFLFKGSVVGSILTCSRGKIILTKVIPTFEKLVLFTLYVSMKLCFIILLNYILQGFTLHNCSSENKYFYFVYCNTLDEIFRSLLYSPKSKGTFFFRYLCILFFSFLPAMNLLQGTSSLYFSKISSSFFVIMFTIFLSNSPRNNSLYYEFY